MGVMFNAEITCDHESGCSVTIPAAVVLHGGIVGGVTTMKVLISSRHTWVEHMGRYYCPAHHPTSVPGGLTVLPEHKP
jgi:hypothetical protein